MKGERDDAVVYGVQPIKEALAANRRIQSLFIAKGGGSKRELVQACKEQGARIVEAPKKALDKKAGSDKHQGVVAVLLPDALSDFVDLEEIVARAHDRGEHPLIVLMDGVEDPRNLGAIIRSAHALGAHGVVIEKDRSAPITGVTVKASAGAIEHIPIARVRKLRQAIETLRSCGLAMVSADVGGHALEQAPLEGPIALIVGSEGRGVRAWVKQESDILVKIPLEHGFDSLNVSVAVGIVLYEIGRRRRA